MNKCSACGNDFGSLNLFDEHRSNFRMNTAQHLIGKCRTPKSMKLRQDGKGTWHTPGVLDKLDKARAARQK